MKKTLIVATLFTSTLLTGCGLFNWGEEPVEQTAPVPSVSEIVCSQKSGTYSFDVKCKGKWGISHDNKVNWLNYNTESSLSNGNNEGDKTIRFGIEESIESDTLVIRLYNEKGTAFVKVFHAWPKQIRFSVGENKYITFAPGNLQYRASTDTWRFASSQREAIGESNSLISPTYDGWIDLFGWGTGDDPTKTSTQNEDYQEFNDWGNNPIGDDAPGTWRTMTKQERDYLAKSRYNGETLLGYYVNGKERGAVILPDSCLFPTGYVLHGNKTNGYYIFRNLTNAQWAQMEEHGAVFLPYGGRRYDNIMTEDGITYYWCCNGMDKREAPTIYCSNDDYVGISSCQKECGCAVRLIKDIE